MRAIADYLNSLKEYKIPKRYEWNATIGVSLKEIGFVNVYDCLHIPDYCCNPKFPKDFDNKLYKKAKPVRVVKEFIKIDPSRLIIAQKFLDKNHLLDLLGTKNYIEPVELRRYGSYDLVKNGHHRLALHYLKKQSIVASVEIMEM